MKLVMEAWHKFLNEAEAKYSGILKLKPSHIVLSDLEALQSILPERASRLDSEDLHVTLIHQSILKPFRTELKNLELPTAPPIILDDKIFERTSPGKRSWAVKLKNQDQMREYVKKIMELLGSSNTNPEPERRFHVSLANLTGEPKDSVR
jgi:hypothetical protein